MALSFERASTDTGIPFDPETPCGDDPLAAFDAFGEAVALLDADGERVLGVTAAFARRLPGVRAGVPWTAALAVASALEDARPGRLESRPLPDGRRLAWLREDSIEAPDVYRYLQARDDLFSTSRTISVSEMATTLAHEISQPIGTIANLLGGLRMRLARTDGHTGTSASAPLRAPGGASGEAFARALDDALDQARFAQSVVARIRDFTQARRPLQERLDVRAPIHDAAALLDWLFSSRGCVLELELPDTELPVRGDATMLQQVLINLLRNAVDAVAGQPPERRRIHVATRLDDGFVGVSVRDSGHGLADRGQQLFVPFATDKVDGMGVGLNICRSFVELHQGRLWLAPNDSGGCTAWVELPIMTEEDDA